MINLDIGDYVVYEHKVGRISECKTLKVTNVCDDSGYVSTKDENGFPYLDMHYSKFRKIDGSSVKNSKKSILSFIFGCK